MLLYDLVEYEIFFSLKQVKPFIHQLYTEYSRETKFDIILDTMEVERNEGSM